MNEWHKIAKKFGVRVSKPVDGYHPESLYLSFTGETVMGVYFYPKENRIRLRRPGFQWVEGDWAMAIAIAITRTYGFDYENCELTRTIRSFKD